MVSVSVYEINCNFKIVQQQKVNSCNKYVSQYSIPNSNLMSKLSLLATLTSVVKGNHLYSSGVGIGEFLFCELESDNLFKVHGNAFTLVKRNENEDQTK